MGLSTVYSVCTLLFFEHFPPIRLWQDCNYKDILNKMQKKMNSTVQYECVKQSGPAHNSEYTVRAVCGKYRGSGTGRTLKMAEQQASLEILKELGFKHFVTGTRI